MTPKGVDVSWQMENSESDDSDECGDKMDVHLRGCRIAMESFKRIKGD